MERMAYSCTYTVVCPFRGPRKEKGKPFLCQLPQDKECPAEAGKKK